MSGVEFDWQQIAAFVAAAAMLSAGFARIVRFIVRQEFDSFRRELNGALDVKIDRRITRRLDPIGRKVDHIDSELARELPGYRQAG